MKKTCPCNKESIEFEKTGSHNIISEKTGFFGYMGFGGSDLWLCPECNKKAKEQAKILFEIVKNDRIYLKHFLRD